MKRKRQGAIREGFGRLFYIVPRMPYFAQIEITNLCNLNCKMCPRHKLGVKFEEMPLDRFKIIIDKLESVVEVNLTGWGEPLCHPKLIEMIRYCKAKGLAVDFTTNAILLNEAMQERLIGASLDKISFSVDYIKPIEGSDEWGHENKMQLKNIEGFAKKIGHPEITLQVTLHKNRDFAVYDVIEFASENKIKHVNLTRLDCRFIKGLDRPKIFEEVEVFRRAERMGKRLGVRVDMIQYGMFSGFKRDLLKVVRPALHRFDRQCPKPFDYIYITTEGNVTPCCLLTKAYMGNLLEQPLKEIWKSKKFRDFQKNHKLLCGSCDILKLNYHKQ